MKKLLLFFIIILLILSSLPLFNGFRAHPSATCSDADGNEMSCLTATKVSFWEFILIR
jgi:hypothetical protein